jgi:hypothetical protein
MMYSTTVQNLRMIILFIAMCQRAEQTLNPHDALFVLHFNIVTSLLCFV